VAPSWFKARQTSDPSGTAPLVDPLTCATVPSAGYNPNRFAVVALATSGNQSSTVTGVRNGTYRDAVTGNAVTVTGGALSFTVLARSAVIYVLNGPGKSGADGTYLR
jgi:hypothetical protein